MSNPYERDSSEYYAFAAGAASRDARIEQLEADLLDTDNRRRVLSARVVQLEAENEELMKDLEFFRLTQESERN